LRGVAAAGADRDQADQGRDEGLQIGGRLQPGPLIAPIPPAE
jgi:hypothetical protein